MEYADAQNQLSLWLIRCRASLPASRLILDVAVESYCIDLWCSRMLPGRNPSLQRDPFPLGTSIALNDLSLGTSIAGPRCQLLVRGTLPRYLPVPTDVFLVFERLSLCFGTSLALNRHEIIRRSYYSNKMLTLELSRSPFYWSGTLNNVTLRFGRGDWGCRRSIYRLRRARLWTPLVLGLSQWRSWDDEASANENPRYCDQWEDVKGWSHPIFFLRWRREYFLEGTRSWQRSGSQTG